MLDLTIFENMGDSKIEDLAKERGESKYPGIFLTKIKQAVVNVSDSGVAMIDIRIQILDEETKNVVSEIDLDTMFLTGIDGKEQNSHKRAKDKINIIRRLLNPDLTNETAKKWNIAETPARAWIADIKEWKEGVMKPQLVDIINKPFYAVITCYHKFQRIHVNGYSRTPIVSYQEDPIMHRQERQSPEVISVPDYSSPQFPSFSIWEVYTFGTKQSLSELHNGINLPDNDPEKNINKTYANAIEKAQKGEFRETELFGRDEIEFRRKLLVSRLGQSFDAARFVKMNSAIDQQLGKPVTVTPTSHGFDLF